MVKEFDLMVRPMLFGWSFVVNLLIVPEILCEKEKKWSYYFTIYLHVDELYAFLAPSYTSHSTVPKVHFSPYTSLSYTSHSTLSSLLQYLFETFTTNFFLFHFDKRVVALQEDRVRLGFVLAPFLFVGWFSHSSFWEWEGEREERERREEEEGWGRGERREKSTQAFLLSFFEGWEGGEEDVCTPLLTSRNTLRQSYLSIISTLSCALLNSRGSFGFFEKVSSNSLLILPCVWC
jgi:hypothetical protein